MAKAKRYNNKVDSESRTFILGRHLRTKLKKNETVIDNSSVTIKKEYEKRFKKPVEVESVNYIIDLYWKEKEKNWIEKTKNIKTF